MTFRIKIYSLSGIFKCNEMVVELDCHLWPGGVAGGVAGLTDSLIWPGGAWRVTLITMGR